MMHFRLSCLSLIFAVVASAQESKSTKVEPRDGKCEITFPSKPTEKAGEKSVQIIMEALDGKAALMLQFNETPNKVTVEDAESVKKIFDLGQKALENKLEGKLVKSEDGKFSGQPSRDIDMEVKGLGIYRVRFIVTDSRFYQVTAAGPKEYVSGDEVKKFMESFKLKD